MAIQTIPPFPLDVGDTFKAKTTARGPLEVLELLGFSPKPIRYKGKICVEVLARTKDTSIRKRPKRIVTTFILTSKEGWKSNLAGFTLEP